MPLIGLITGKPVDDLCFECQRPFTADEMIMRIVDANGDQWCLHQKCFERLAVVTEIEALTEDEQKTCKNLISLRKELIAKIRKAH